ncbi:putative quinol monooxygenase [Pedobacter mucosus]|uniref:putative quinol monooxygenase n=1 Tax=Pedobacter mucosus TaxID=2895286 RepID=UPI001EE3B262|nr:putative quinol monooxygenase [Pedobacter mucosus]UKT63378.1 antibiotic biosynthesis monooxygenase [Pedobacter mucosus]
MSIYLTVVIKSKEDKVEELKNLLMSMVDDSRKEQACLQYDLHACKDENIFIFHEEWLDQAGLDAHNLQHYIVDFSAKVPSLTESLKIYKTEKLA